MEHHIIPKPKKVQILKDSFSITPETIIMYSPEALGVATFLARFLRPPTGFSFPMERLKEDRSNTNTIKLILKDNEAKAPEAYSLAATLEQIQIVSATPQGLFYGIQSLRQLLPLEIELKTPAKNIEWTVHGVNIEDSPRFQWRGLHLDVARHFYPLSFIKKFIDLMALHKFNVFHWHLTDDQGWRIEINKYPRLTEVGAYRNASPLLADRKSSDNTPYGGFYTRDEVSEVVEYAAERFVTVVPEIEMPGHALAALAAYPELGCVGKGYEVAQWWGMMDDVFCAGNEKLYSFLEDILIEVFDLFPSELIHIGGDECPKVRWETCPKCQEKIKAEGFQDENELQSYVIRRLERFLNRNGRRLIGWDEIIEGGLAPNATVMSWRGSQGGIDAAKSGHNVIMTPNTFCYFDYYQSKDQENEPPAIGGFIPLEKAYQFDPTEGVPIDKEAFILGGQGNIWTEYMPTSVQVEYMTYPRASALAEALWYGRGNDYNDFLVRLAYLLRRLNSLEVNYRRLDHISESNQGD
jgi:hexosaminidase